MSRMLCHMTAVHGEPRTANEGQAHGWTPDDREFGARLALIRQRMQWNIKEAARECGIPAASWGSWEAGAMPRRYLESCRLIAERTGVDLGWLMMGSRVRGLSEISDPPRPDGRPASPEEPKRHAASRPLGPSRRDITRPSSPVPPSRRRPSPVRPGDRVMAA
jgi:transcriptional regulator with XRE-family HTH domain